MQYRGESNFDHGRPERLGVLITNLGTPDAPTPGALRRYLAEFLSDPRVVEVPRLLWWLILHGIILRIRPARSAAAYREVWTGQGSPLLLHTQDQCKGLRRALEDDYGDDLVVDYAMRYGSPSIGEALQRLQDQNVTKLLVLPLYPQYSASTAASTFDALAADFTRRRRLPDLRFVSHYHDYEPYIDALAQQVRTHWQKNGRGEKIVFSYHGVPMRYLHNGDPYHCECLKTSRLLAQKLELGEEEYLTTFQSRFGREPWLQPYTDETMKALPKQGVKTVDVFCPGFSSDCLETIEEIDQENREYFIEAGGERFQYIPCLNAESVHIQALAQLVRDNLRGWSRPDNSPASRQARESRARACHYNRSEKKA